jgi:cysteine desulfurase
MLPIYLDYNATTPIAPAVQEAMLPFLAEHYGNPSSSHALGRASREAIEDARGQVAMLLECDHEDVVFTSGGTESNNLAIKGVMLREPPSAGGHLVISAIEHPAVMQPARWLERQGYAVTVVGCNREGLVEPEAVEAALRPTTRLVSIMHANNETGVIQPIRQIAALCRARGVLVHTDAAQSAGKIRTAVKELGVDLLTIAGHKLYAPKGIGALYLRPGIPLEPVIHGAGQEGGIRPGTENTPYIVGLGCAAMTAHKHLDAAAERMAALRDKLERRLRSAIGPSLRINGGGAERLPNTLSVSFPGVVGGELLARIPELYASTGAACHSDAPASISATLAAMRLTAPEARGTIRLSTGWYTTEAEIDRAADLLLGAWEALKERATA